MLPVFAARLQAPSGLRDPCHHRPATIARTGVVRCSLRIVPRPARPSCSRSSIRPTRPALTRFSRRKAAARLIATLGLAADGHFSVENCANVLLPTEACVQVNNMIFERAVLWATRRCRPYWTDLRGVSNTYAVRAFILVPLLGYWIILNEHVVSKISDLSCLLVNCKQDAPQQPPWRLFASYFGLCCIAAGSAIYQWCCPRVIKDHPDATAYTRANSRDISETQMEQIEEELHREPLAAEKAKGHRGIYSRRRSNVSGPGFSPQDTRDVIQDFWRNLLQEDFDLRNSRCFPGRVIVTACYAIGFVVLMFPTLDVFFRVFGALLRSI